MGYFKEFDQVNYKDGVLYYLNDSNVWVPIPGIGGDVLISSEVAGETISSGKIVFSEGGKMYNFDPSDVNLYGRAFGLSKTSGTLDSPITIQWSGKFSEVGLGLTADQYYFAGTSGLPTLDITGFNLIQPIGFAIDADSLMINFSTSILTT